MRDFEHQRRELELYRDAPARALLWTMRTGKSRAVVQLAAHLAERAAIDAVLVLAPNGVHLSWARDQFPTHAPPNVPFVCHAWRSSHRTKASERAHEASLRECLDDRYGVPVLAVNSECLGADRVKKMLKQFVRRRRALAVFDESSDFRTPSSTRSRVARGLAKVCPFRRILDGTPVANSPLAAWAQFELLEHGALGFERFTDFRAHHAEYRVERRGGREYPALDCYRDLDGLRERMAPWSSVVVREDVRDLPPLMRTRRYVGIAPEAERVYRELAKSLAADIRDGTVVTAIEGGARAIKLQQCLSGFVIDEAGAVHDLSGEGNPRMDALVEEVEGTAGKVIVWCQFREDCRRVAETLRARGHLVLSYAGGVSQSLREQNVRDFRDHPGVKALVGQPRAGGRGLDLSAASAVVWFSHTPDALTREQADERGTRIGGASVAVVDLVAPDTVDEHLLDITARKRETADSVAGTGLRDLLRCLEASLA